MALFRLFLGLTTLLTASCSLEPAGGRVQIRVAWPKGEIRRGTATLNDMQQCLYVTALSSGGQPTLSKTALDGLDPATIGADGTLFGPYTKSQLQAGVALTVPLANTRLRILGVDGPHCDTQTFAQNFQRSSLSGLYLISEATADLATKTNLSLIANLDISTPNSIGNATRSFEANPNLYLNVYQILRGTSGNAGTSTINFAAGTLNYDGSNPFEIRFSDFLDVFKKVSYTDMNGVGLHERYDILLSTNGISLATLDNNYAALVIRATGRTTSFNSPDAYHCDVGQTGSPSPNFEIAVHSLGMWVNVTAAIPNGGGFGIASTIVTRPVPPYSWSAIVSGSSPPLIRVSLRAQNPVATGLCTAFTLTKFEAYFQPAR